MKFFASLVLFCSVITASFANGVYTSHDSNVVITDVSVDGVLVYDSVTLNLDFVTGQFVVMDAKEKVSTVSEAPLQTFESENGYSVGFLGCEKTGETLGTDKIDVVCSIQIINHQDDRLISFGGISNNPARIENNLLATNYTSTISSGEKSSSTYPFLELFLAKEVPVNVSFNFWVNSNASSISSFEVETMGPNFEDLDEITFTDIGAF